MISIEMKICYGESSKAIVVPWPSRTMRIGMNPESGSSAAISSKASVDSTSRLFNAIITSPSNRPAVLPGPSPISAIRTPEIPATCRVSSLNSETRKPSGFSRSVADSLTTEA